MTKHTIVDKCLDLEKTDRSSLHEFICKAGKVPVAARNSVQATNPLNEELFSNNNVITSPKLELSLIFIR